LIHLTFDPISAKDVGFQLSYAAMFGIAYIFPYMRKMWTNDLKILKWIWESAALSISCQLTTGPLAWYYFGTFPQYFLLTNLLALPLTGILIPIALLTVTMTAVGWCPDIVIYVTECLAQSMIEALSIIASM
jgi:competence protein ComEC